MSNSISFRLFSVPCLLVATLIFAGCQDSKIGTVSGVVTIDGKPIEMASISFYPEFGRASVARSNDKGEYVLNYTNDRSDLIRSKGRKELVPEKYHDRDKTELTAVVEAGSNQIDFNLEL